MLISRLPQESWTQTALRDLAEHELLAPEPGEQKFGPWGLVNHQLATLTDMVRAQTYVVAQVGGRDKYPLPEPTPRPGGNRLVRTQSTAGVLYLDRLRARG